ncbi:hypothetical protein CTAYLR_010049 [Chrysophaeum taylorii]|uniref:Formin-like protein n=1 Tax=Chrysophaeum taylorii TaxID=2483200 RepID=A0AAD7UA14_9STRA|nr:hypothetical protein CTAYLR_010049 [Chrysophaeum taylorii]
MLREVVLEREHGGQSWGLNIGRRGAQGPFVVTSVQDDSPAAKVVDTEGEPADIQRGDEIAGIGPMDGAVQALDHSKSQADMRTMFSEAGVRARLVLRRRAGLRSWAAERVGRARRSVSVDVRAATRKITDAASQLLGISGAPPSEAVRLAGRVFAAVGGEPLDAETLVASLELTPGDRGDALDDEPLRRLLVLNVGNPMHEPIPGRVVELGWEAPRGSSTPSLRFASKLGLAAAAWLDLDDRTVVVVCDACDGDRARVGLAGAIALRIVASVLGIVTADATVEAFEAYLDAVGGDTLRDLAVKRLPPSFARTLRHVDLAVEARRLPNPRPLELLGVSVRGLPLSEPPVISVATSAAALDWTSDDVVDWDGDEAFYGVGNCVISGDFAVVVRFRGAQVDEAAAIARYVASTGFLSDGAIDVRFHDVDVHPAYANALSAVGGDFRIRLAFKYADADPIDDFALPLDRDDAVYEGLGVISRHHSLASPAMRDELDTLGDPLVARLALQLANDDLDTAFMLTATLTRLHDVSILAQQRRAGVAPPPPPRRKPVVEVDAKPREEEEDDEDELDAKPSVVVRDWDDRRACRHDSLPPPKTASAPADLAALSGSATVVQPRPADYRPVDYRARPVDYHPVDYQSYPQPVDYPPPVVVVGSYPRPTPGDVMPPPPIHCENAAAAEEEEASLLPPDSAVKKVGPPPRAAKVEEEEEEEKTNIVEEETKNEPEPPSVEEARAAQEEEDSKKKKEEEDSKKKKKKKNMAAREALAAKLTLRPPENEEEKSSTTTSTSNEAPAAKPTPEPPPPSCSKSEEGKGDRLGDHPVMKQFVKLLKVGLPRGAVAKKMQEEGVDPALLDMDLEAAPTEEALAMLSRPASQQQKAPAREWGGRKSTGRRPTLKPVHWEQLGKTEGTVWATSEQRAVDEHERAELKRLFTVTAGKDPTKIASETEIDEACDAKRAANVAIGLQPLTKQFDDLEEVLRSALRLDASRLTAENVEQLRALVPSDAEAKETRRLFFDLKKSPKRPAEAFFAAAVKVAEDVGSVAILRSRLGVFADVLTAEEVSCKLRLDAGTIAGAADKARESRALAEALQRLLSVGNALNEGTRRGGAAGFRLASLSRLATTKSPDGVSVLEFAARKPLEADPELRALRALAAPLKAARKLSLADMRSDLQQLEATTAAVGKLDADRAVECRAYATQAAAALATAEDRASSAAKYFGEEDDETATMFGLIADFLDDFCAARVKHAASKKKDAGSSELTPAEKRETRHKARNRRGLDVDDILNSAPSKQRAVDTTTPPP